MNKASMSTMKEKQE